MIYSTYETVQNTILFLQYHTKTMQNTIHNTKYNTIEHTVQYNTSN